MILPHLGGDEDVLAFDAGRAQPLPDFALIAIHLGGVDMAIAKPQRLLDDTRTRPPAQVPRAETDRGNARAVRLDIGRHHGLSLLVGPFDACGAIASDFGATSSPSPPKGGEGRGEG